VHGGGIRQNDPAIAYTVKPLLSVSPKKSGILYFPVRTKSNARNNWALFTPSNSVNLKPNGLINLKKTHFDFIEMIFTRRIFFRLF